MPAYKSLLKRVEIETAERQRQCKRTKLKLPRGSRCLVVFESERDRFNYGRATGLKMIAVARQLLDELERELREGVEE